MKGRLFLGLLVVLALGLVLGGRPASAQDGQRTYDLLYDVRLVPTEGVARVELRLGRGAGAVRWLRFRIDAERHRDFEGDGEIERGEGFVTWHPPAAGGRLRFRHPVDHLRDERSYDARCGRSFALFRGDDLIPRARVRTVKGARSESRLRLRLPDGWTAVTPYPKNPDGTLQVDHPDRRFDRPTGWMVAGKLGVLRERIAGVSVAVAGPVGHNVRRHDLLAMLRWTLPSLRKILGPLPDRLLVVSAGDPMWRGGLSGPRSLFVHADRPLIARDGTSPLLHELFHTMTRARAGAGGDWVVEGLAELYSLELLVRSGTLARKRFERSLARLERRGRGAGPVRVERASGDVTARAVGILRDLDAQLRERSGDTARLDHVLPRLIGTEVTTESFAAACEEAAGVELDDFFERIR